MNPEKIPECAATTVERVLDAVAEEFGGPIVPRVCRSIRDGERGDFLERLRAIVGDVIKSYS